mmetsp:Transcript_4502/g.3715  ORF Transcript_4502/g.3715 Transcript_4502/m.3715 type:complete len:139 (-) Transcript_4502:222-638(-)
MKMKKVPGKDVKARSSAITRLFESYRCYDDLIGTEQMVWIRDKEVNKKYGAQLVGHTKAYVKVLFPVDEKLLGKAVKIKVTEAHKWHIVGEIVDREPKFEKVPEDYFGESKQKEEEKINEIPANKEQEGVTITQTNET